MRADITNAPCHAPIEGPGCFERTHRGAPKLSRLFLLTQTTRNAKIQTILDAPLMVSAEEPWIVSLDENAVTAPIIIEENLQGDHVLLQCRVPPDLFYFQGHFANISVVPGVCQIKWVVDTIDRCFNRKIALAGMEAVKFHQLLTPGDLFTIDIKRGAQGRKWVYSITSGDLKIAAGRLVDRIEESGAAS